MFGILVFGDSITHGRGEQPNIGWVGRLKQDFEKLDPYNTVYNLGIPGDTSSDLVERFETELRSRVRYSHDGDRFVVIIAIGANDARSVDMPENIQTQPGVFSANLRKMIAAAKKLTEEIALVGLTPVDEELTNPYEDTFFTNTRQQEYDELIAKAAKDEGLGFINTLQELLALNYRELLEDGLHPNKQGYDRLYESINRQLKEKKLIP